MFNWIYKHQKFVLSLLISFFFISIIPICIIAGYDCASGDDYNYGSGPHLAYLSTGSVLAAVSAACKTTVDIWHNWQGTWFDVFAFCLHPEVFSDSAYVIVPYIFMIMQIAAVCYFSYYFLKVKWKIDGFYWLMVAAIFLLFSFQLVPSQKAAFFWWVGCIHYCMPFCLSLVTIALTDRFLTLNKLSDLIWISLGYTLLGGATYPASLLVFLSGIILLLVKYMIENRSDKKDLFLIIPYVLELIGLGISMIAPGNANRAAADLAEGAEPAGGLIATIVSSIIFSVQDAVTYFFAEKSFILIALIIVVLITCAFFKQNRFNINNHVFAHPLLFVITLFLLNASVYAPRMYTGNTPSSGYMNFNLWICFSCMIAIVIYLCGWAYTVKSIKFRLPEYSETIGTILSVIAIMFIMVLGRHGVKEYTDYICLDYYLSGQADDFRDQMRLQKQLMEDPTVTDVVVPEINFEQGPLMHMPVFSDPENINSYMTSAFYGKNSCRSIPRAEWFEKYNIDNIDNDNLLEQKQ
ncbi:hypothetical protein [Butyrivibrio sp. AE3003]|uniref:hypothetical protein n=1 Tax=Butyrivibrio sp. AE3003 TaxID=1496721 RepID=UPI00047B4345|nr:hypothetical protein [Butyrivibrio sp. AE3003]